MKRLLARINVMANKLLSIGPVISFFDKNPRIGKFISDRFSLESFGGLRLTLALILFFSNLFLFTGIADDIQDIDEVIAADTIASEFVSSIRSDRLNTGFYNFTFLASTIFITSLVALVTLILVIKRHWNLAAGFVLTWAGAAFSSWLGKNHFERGRPRDAFYDEESFSFPSGHATFAVAVYGFLIYAFVFRNTFPERKSALYFLGLLFILLMGFSRVYLGVHFLSDVLAGYCLGSMWLLTGISFTESSPFRS